MSMFWRWVWMIPVCLGVASAELRADPVAFARLNQDIQLLSERVNRLQLSVSVMERENEALRADLDRQKRAQQGMLQQFAAYREAVEGRLEVLAGRERVIKQEMVTEVSRQIKALAEETQKALDALAKAQGSQPRIEPEIRFDDSYPQTGIPYVVQPGDTLSGIARRFNSTIRDIQNANRIANPSRDLQVGSTIFVPQRNN